MKLFITFLLLCISSLSFSQNNPLSEMAFKRMAKENTQRNKDSVYFANYELDSTKLTNAILVELNKERKLNHLKLATCSKDSSQCTYVMAWSRHLAEIRKVGHGGTRLYNAEVVTSGSLTKSQAGVDSQYAIIANNAIQAFMNSPEHRRLIMTPEYTKVVIGFACHPGQYSGLSTIIVIGLINGSNKQ
jgi:uncharacterized protein YkwD